MILDFSVKNFFSFKEGVTLSFRLDDKCPDSISNGKNYSTVMCIKGTNASGKTQLIKSVSFICDFIARSFSAEPDSLIPLDSFNHNLYPTDFEITFEAKGERYLYELSVTDKKVISETLTQITRRKTPLFRREENTVVDCLKKYDPLRNIILRSNVSLISTARQHGVEFFTDIANYFRLSYSNVSYGGFKPTNLNVKSISKILNEHSESFSFVKSFIKECDTGVSDIKIIEDKESGDSKEKRFYPVFIHQHEDGEIRTTEVGESSGTKRLFIIMGMIKTILDSGGLLLMDELDIHLHPHILKKIVGLFISNETNKHDAQLILSTHNTEIMDELGRYRTMLVEKKGNESYAYRLDEVPSPILRNDRPISTVYNAGRIGGVPDFDAAKGLT